MKFWYVKYMKQNTLHHITFYLADTFIQGEVQSSAIQGHTTIEHAR